MTRGGKFQTVDEAKQRSSQELRVMVRRLMKCHMNSEEIKEWFVQELPQALRGTPRGIASRS